MIHFRVPFRDGEPRLTVAPGATARVSLAWLDEAGEPVLVAGPTGLPQTVVIRWPTDSRGHVDSEAISRGNVAALIWTVDRRALADLRWIADRWHVPEHDLLVDGDGSVSPCRETLMHCDLFDPRPLADRVVASINTERPGSAANAPGPADSEVVNHGPTPEP